MDGEEPNRHSFLRSRAGLVLFAFLAIGGFLLAYEHRAHLFAGNAAILVLLGGCVLMHLFMRHGHAERDRDGDGDGGR